MHRIGASYSFHTLMALTITVILLGTICVTSEPYPIQRMIIDNASDDQISYSESYLFPSSEYISYENADGLAESISSRLELQNPIRVGDAVLVSPADFGLLNANQTKILAADLLISEFDEPDYNELFYVDVKYICGSVAIHLCYDNLNESGRLFRALEISCADDPLRNSTDVLASSIDILTLLDVPYTECESRVANLSTTIIPYESDTLGEAATINETRVIFHSKISEMDLWGGNNAGFKFNDEGQMMEFQCGAFIDVQSESGVDSGAAFDIAHSEINGLLEDPGLEMIVEEEIIDIRIFPVAVLDDQTAGRELHVAYTYRAHIEIELYGTFYLQFLLIDTDDGALLKSVRGVGGAHSVTPTPRDATITLPIPVEILVPGLISGVLLGIILIGPIEFSYPILAMFVIPLYLRIKKSKVLDNFNRGRIYQFISANPGTSYSEMKSALGIPNGCISYHLGILEKSEIIRTVQDGRIKRHYIVGVPNHSLFAFLSKTQSRIIDALHANGQMTTSQIAAELNISRQRTHHNLKRLSERGILQSAPSGWILTMSDQSDG